MNLNLQKKITQTDGFVYLSSCFGVLQLLILKIILTN